MVRAWDVFLDQRMKVLTHESPGMGKKQRFAQIVQEWRDAGVGVGPLVQMRATIEAQQALYRRAWKKRKISECVEPGREAAASTAGLHIEAVD